MDLHTVFMSFVFSITVGYAQQVIGTYPVMNGGFEGISAGAITVLSSVNSPSTIWTTAGSGQSGIFVTGGGRTGDVYANVTQSGTAHKRMLQSPTDSSTSLGYAGNGTYTIQFYYRGDKDGILPDPPAGMLRGGKHINGTSNPSPNNTAYIINPNATSWTKFAGASTTTLGTCSLLVGSISVNNTAIFDIDDYVIYAGPEDITAPDPVTSPQTPTIRAGQIELSWTAPGTGVDVGGYIVVLKQDSDPSRLLNVNGIYAVGNSVAPRE